MKEQQHKPENKTPHNERLPKSRPQAADLGRGETAVSPTLNPATILQLQHLLGNGYVQRQLQPRHTQTALTIQREDEDSAAGDSPPPQPETDSRNYAFIFTGGSYGEAAEAFISTYYPEYHLISAHSFEEMFDRLWRDIQQLDANQRIHINEIIIVTHANAAGGMKIPLTRGRRDRMFTPWDLADLQEEFREGVHDRFRQRRREVIHQAIDERTNVVIRGCELGQSDEALDALRSFFGGQVDVVAPRGFQGYEVLSVEQIAAIEPGDGNPYIEAFDFLARQEFVPIEMVGMPDDEKEAYIRNFVREHGGIPAEFFVMGQEAHDALQERIAAGNGRDAESEQYKVREATITDMSDGAPVPFNMPPLSGAGAGVTVDRWLKQEGSQVDRGEAALQVVTGETYIRVNAPYEGRLTNVQVTAGGDVSPGVHLADIRMAYWNSSSAPLGVDPEIDRMSTAEIEAEARHLRDPYRPQHAARLLRLWRAWQRKPDVTDRALSDTSGDPLAGLGLDIFGDSNLLTIDANRYPDDAYIDTFEQETISYAAGSEEAQQQAGTFVEPESSVEPRPAAGGGATAVSPTPRPQPTPEQRRAAADFSKRRRTPEPEPEPEPAPADTHEEPPQQQTVTLPGVHELSPSERMMLEAILAGSMLNPATAAYASLIQGARVAAAAMGVTIAIGPAVSGNAVAGIGGGGGLFFGPNGEIGAYGSVAGRVGVAISISATLQVTVVNGGPNRLSGSAVAVGGGGGELLVGGGAVLLTPDGDFLGISAQVGVGAGLTPLEAYVEAQETWTSTPVVAPPPLP
ncbi:MAG: lipoyl domain-containing protein [Chloroflexota bacterium]